MRVRRPGVVPLACALLLPICVLASQARAEGSSSGAGVNALSPTKGPEVQERVFGTWAGWRTRLHDWGLDVELSYLGETAWNAAGGKRQGVDYAGQEEAKLALDWGKIAGLRGFSTHVDFVNRNGRSTSADYVGDDLLAAQEIFGGGGDVLAHLAFLYAEQKLSGGALDLKAGRLPVLLDFGYLPDSCDFMALGICATRPLSANVGWTPFPFATWGSNVRAQAGGAVSLAVGAYEVNPRRGEPSGFSWSLRGATGALLPAEVDWQPKLGASGLPGVFKLGGYLDTSQLPEWGTATEGAPPSAATLPARHSAQTGFYVLAQQMVRRTGPLPGEGLTVLAGFVRNSPGTSLFQRFAFVGLLDKGLVPGRPDDRAGLSFVHARVSTDLSATQMLQAQLGAPLSNSAPGVQMDEMLVEANYDVAAYRGVEVMPDLQYVICPIGTSRYPNALVLGLQVKARF